MKDNFAQCIKANVELADDNVAMRARITELEHALEPFARCVQRTDEFLARVAENSTVMEKRDLFMWQAPRSLCVNDFRVAAKALGLQ